MISRRGLLAGAGVLLASRDARAQSPASRAPVLYVSHGSPLYLPHNGARRAELGAWGAAVSRDHALRGIVVVTPHFGSRALAVGATGPGLAWYDLPGGIKGMLPQDLAYATPPSEPLAARLESLLGPVTRATGRPGFDHTTWMPLRCMFPAASVPVLELAYPYVPEAEAVKLGQKLAPLRDEGILFVASGGMTHNLAAADFSGAPPPRYTTEFDAWATETVSAGQLDALIDWRHRAPAASLAHPDEGEHFRVLLIAMGVAGAARATFPVTGFESTLSKRCVELG